MHKKSYVTVTDQFDLSRLPERIRARIDFDGPTPPDPSGPVEGG